ncbi:DUF6503 family protein [Algoriphagus aquimarinus]|uniref:Uncharacterized protein n=1 Tax=Algoriphagus aquimarinus TaxID=237018 RepID=A0A1I0YEC8_9BACT|nr:DUF6503 family protein [Algoriphagus aquimarinus]SFB10860.1 hypothetical protein SAMN04489723_104237 [Algoriphagus aquimarinus]|tara:strand:+ start:58138 stop:58815 length:678 start_codon:yes stop_codon:yes gene_type:complete
MKHTAFFSIVILMLSSCASDTYMMVPTGQELIEKSIAYHDPNGNWSDLKATFLLEDSLPAPRESRSYSFSLDNTQSIMSYKIDGTSYVVYHDSLQVEMGEITLDRALRSRNYYTYLWGLPMKLQDAGTNIDAVATLEELNGKEYHVVRVPYDKDIWYFYLEPETYRMAAYKFYQDEPNLKGEIIYLDGLTEFEGMKIPSNRSWYRTEKPEFLGTDKLIGVQQLSK